jgi:hypothetical protein
MKNTRERQEEQRRQKLAEMQAQIDRGSLVVRQLTAEERKEHKPRPPKPKRGA